MIKLSGSTLLMSLANIFPPPQVEERQSEPRRRAEKQAVGPGVNPPPPADKTE